jgi:hypothetical protein
LIGAPFSSPGDSGACGGGDPSASALALVALCVGMVLARNVCDSDLADDFRRSAHDADGDRS